MENTTPKSNLSPGKIQEYYRTTENWISDLLFYRDELKFLQHVVDRYYNIMVKLENLDEMREGVIRLNDLKYRCASLLRAIRKLQKRLSERVKTNNYKDPRTIIASHERTSKKFQTFLRDVRASKREIFSIADEVLEMQK